MSSINNLQVCPTRVDRIYLPLSRPLRIPVGWN